MPTMITVQAFGNVCVLTLSGNMELLNEFEKVFELVVLYWLYWYLFVLSVELLGEAFREHK